VSLNLNNCDKACLGCVRGYAKKHTLKKGQEFTIRCKGIPQDFIPQSVLQSIDESERATSLALFDPVIWARDNLDWHCLDPDGSIWMRKNPVEYDEWREENPDADILGNSRYHRPYQAEMLRCTSKRKVFRIGRQAGKTESLVVSMLFNLFNKPGVPEDEGFKIIVITPYQSQIDLIFTRLMQLIGSSPILQNSVKSSVKSPTYTIKLHNGSVVRGFTAGTKSGGNAEAVRGQTGHMLVFDEADYLSRGDIDAAMSIITNYPNATVWMSSTPSGKREHFYEKCDSKTWKEFHFPSTVNPLFNEQLELSFREELSEIAYVHEVEADFGEQEQGVFQNAYVQAAKADYKYGDLQHYNTWTYTVGVDWNDTANGTTINVLGFNPTNNQFYIVDRHVVSRDGWTQLSACNKIAEVNRLWLPKAIYVDAGYGATQLEVLHKFGWDSLQDKTKGPNHPDAQLRSIVKAYNFGSKVETHDLFTKQPVQKQAKPFLVEQTIRRFEAGDLKFPETDENLEAQLLGYIIDRISPTGVPVYKAGNEKAGDHALDALMLSIIAFVLEATPLGKPKYSSYFSFSGQFGEKRETPAGEGSLVVKGSNKERHKEQREKQKPEGNRGEIIEQQSLFPQQGLPANHTHGTSKPRLWAHPGFNRDAPAPSTRTLQEAGRDARQRLGISPRRAGRPTRKNI
jgi:replicative DNA helicase